MRCIGLAVLLVSAAMLGGCGSDEKDEEDRETVFDPLLDTLEEAEQLNDIALEQKARMDEALRQAEGCEEKPEE